jgi:hypothetical protein
MYGFICWRYRSEGSMVANKRFRLFVIMIVLVAAGLVLFGVPSSKFNFASSVVAAPYDQNNQPGEPLCLQMQPDGSMPPLATITCSQTVLFDMPGGSGVVKDGAVLAVGAGSRWFIQGAPVTDKSGQLWQAIFVGGPHCPYIPLTCTR